MLWSRVRVRNRSLTICSRKPSGLTKFTSVQYFSGSEGTKEVDQVTRA